MEIPKQTETSRSLAAQHELVDNNRGIIGIIVRKLYHLDAFRLAWSSYEDLYQSALVAALSCARPGRYDEARGTFGTYIGRALSSLLWKELQRRSLITLPVHTGLDVRRETLGLPPKYLKPKQFESAKRVINADFLPVAASHDGKTFDVLEHREDVQQTVERNERVSMVRAAIKSLDRRERLIIRAHFGVGRPRKTFRQISKRLAISRERVRQIERDAIAKLKSSLEAHVDSLIV